MCQTCFSRQSVSGRFDGTRRHPFEIVRLAESKSGPNSRAASPKPAACLSGTLVTLLARTGTAEGQTGLKSVATRFQRILNARLCVAFSPSSAGSIVTKVAQIKLISRHCGPWTVDLVQGTSHGYTPHPKKGIISEFASYWIPRQRPSLHDACPLDACPVAEPWAPDSSQAQTLGEVDILSGISSGHIGHLVNCSTD